MAAELIINKTVFSSAIRKMAIVESEDIRSASGHRGQMENLKSATPNIPEVVEIEPEVLDGHVELGEGPLVQIVQRGEGDPEGDPVLRGEVSAQQPHNLSIGGHLLARDTHQMGRAQPAGAGRDGLPHGAVGHAHGEAEDREQQR